MDKNPFTIKPGQDLEMSRVFNQYLDWWLWNKANGVSKMGTCTRYFWRKYLCCQQHMDEKAEMDAFFRYFKLLSGSRSHTVPENEFSLQQFVNFVLEYGIEINHEKCAKYLGMDVQSWKSLLPGKLGAD
jgi:hypothetical protein